MEENEDTNIRGKNLEYFQRNQLRRQTSKNNYQFTKKNNYNYNNNKNVIPIINDFKNEKNIYEQHQ